LTPAQGSLRADEHRGDPPAQAQPLRDAAYAAGCDPTIVPPPTGWRTRGAGLRPAPR